MSASEFVNYLESAFNMLTILSDEEKSKSYKSSLFAKFNAQCRNCDALYASRLSNIKCKGKGCPYKGTNFQQLFINEEPLEDYLRSLRKESEIVIEDFYKIKKDKYNKLIDQLLTHKITKEHYAERMNKLMGIPVVKKTKEPEHTIIAPLEDTEEIKIEEVIKEEPKKSKKLKKEDMLTEEELIEKAPTGASIKQDI